jgi:hypothetical protein
MELNYGRGCSVNLDHQKLPFSTSQEVPSSCVSNLRGPVPSAGVGGAVGRKTPRRLAAHDVFNAHQAPSGIEGIPTVQGGVHRVAGGVRNAKLVRSVALHSKVIKKGKRS